MSDSHSSRSFSSLRRKLLTLFGGLVAIALLVAGVALVITLSWQSTTADLEDHYRRSLVLERVRASTFQALKEVDDALTDDAVDARADYESAIEPAARDFAEWASLARTDAERAELLRVRGAHAELLESAGKVFERLNAGDKAGAIQLVDDELDTKDMKRFRDITDRAVATDRAIRQAIERRTAEVRRTAQILILISLLGILSLALLLAAYLGQDLFRPLRELSQSIDRLLAGDSTARVDASRDDELGLLATKLNLLADKMQRDGARVKEGAGDQAAHPDLDLAPSDLRILIHDLAHRHRDALVARGATLELQVPGELQPTLVDRARVSAALDEILRNAINALPEQGGRTGVRVIADPAGLHARIEIADNGNGMDGDLIERALGADPFEHSTPKHRGLALARDVALRHGGALRLFSEPGGGTVVRLELPSRL